MNATHRKMRAAIFADPVSKTLEWRRIEALRVAVGCQMIEGNGSRVRYLRRMVTSPIPPPHSAKEAKLYQGRYARQYIENLGVRP